MAPSLLVLTDFSAAADHALAYAAALATATQGQLVLLHGRRHSMLDAEAFTDRLQHLSEGEIAAALAERAQRQSVPTIVEAAGDRVPAAVTDAVRRHGSWLVVLGKPDTESVPDALVSSTSLELLRAASCPLLVVPVVAKHTAVPPQHILLAADDMPLHMAPGTVEAFRKFLETSPVRFTLTHVVEPEDNDSCATALQQLQASGLTEADQLVRTHGVRSLRPAEGIQQAAADTHADLLVLLARPHSFWGKLFHKSVTADAVRRSRIPVLVLPTLQ
ncbi:universal stress protein [Hymenobacter sp. BT491]|uniref:universal stress protein n=1 Tax=Hymenobacter sp. BT491 TaxID=2766779 RepID=UPI001653DBCC|nr:universal stress protein [Hymenobacter sp. BT491]MBC6988656.1 universal stress protein [Hymenobacter sp. BT491]